MLVDLGALLDVDREALAREAIGLAALIVAILAALFMPALG